MSTHKSTRLAQLNGDLDKCRLCLDAGFSITASAIYSHPYPAEVMLIGQAPGVTEVEANRPFNAGSGRRLFQWLEQAGWREDDFRARHVMTAVTKCYPGKARNGKGDRLPGKHERELCRPFLEREIRLYDPRLIIPVGGQAIKLFYPAALKLDEIIGMGAYLRPEELVDALNFDLVAAEHLDHFVAEKPRSGRWIVPLPHPSGASLWPNKPRNKALIEKATSFLGRIRQHWRL